jgi:phosphoglycerate transport regulatory protein PgtC
MAPATWRASRDTTKAMQDAEAAMAGNHEFNAIFKKRRKKATTKVTGRQAEVEQEWDATVEANYAKAKLLAEKAKSML